MLEVIEYRKDDVLSLSSLSCLSAQRIYISSQPTDYSSVAYNDEYVRLANGRQDNRSEIILKLIVSGESVHVG